MGLKGQLEDLPLIDMLQIIAFSKKSGYLRIAGPAGRGAVVLSDGRVLFAFSWSTMERLREMARDPGRVSDEAKRENIEAALRELAGLREGSFRFELTSEIADHLGGVPITPFMVADGLDPQGLLLDLAVEIDNERRETTSLLELAFHGDPPPEGSMTSEFEQVAQNAPAADPLIPEPVAPSVLGVAEQSVAADAVPSATPELDARTSTIVLVDDEAPVTDVVGMELKARGYQVFTASSPGAGADLIRTRRQKGESVLVAVDLKMPTSSGESFYGGFELIRRLRIERYEAPVLLMAESFSDAARDQAKALGVRRIVYKPTLTKPDPELYRADLREFSASVETQLHKLFKDHHEMGGAFVSVPVDDGNNGNETGRPDFIAAMTKKLVEPGGPNDVSLLVMQVAARFLERGVLFVVKSDTARGLAGFGFGSNEKHCADVARGLSVAIDDAKSLTEVISTGRTLRLTEGLEGLGSEILDTIGRGNASEGVLMPMLYNRATLLLLYGDNGVAGRALGDLNGLELFMAQAGMALENRLLQRKLGSDDYPAVDNLEQGVQP